MEMLSVLYDGELVGRIAVWERDRRKIHGGFLPGPGYDRCRAAFEEAARLDWLVEEARHREDDWDRAFGGYAEAIGAITAHVTLPEVGQAVEEFEVFHTSAVYVLLYPPPDPNRPVTD